MFIFLTKFLPLFVYPLGLAFALGLLALILRRWPGWQRGLWMFALLVLWIGSNRWVALSLSRSLEWRYLPPDPVPHAGAIVILGGGTDPVEYPRTSVEVNGAADRVLYGADLYQQGLADHILLTGGRISWMGSGPTPAEEMANILEGLGVPEEALWLESESRNTYENAVNSREILDEKGIHKILLVTSALHMPRSVALFRNQGLEVIPAPTDYSVTFGDWERLKSASLPVQILSLVPSADNLSSVTAALKEYIGILFYRLQGVV
jgi:uncharacterized SAM-binding protein YcdF (DUF218 family)